MENVLAVSFFSSAAVNLGWSVIITHHYLPDISVTRLCKLLPHEFTGWKNVTVESKMEQDVMK